jgi:hypothetical protein
MTTRILDNRAAMPLMVLAAATGIGVACAEPPYDGPMRGGWTVAMTLESTLPGRAVPRGTTVAGTVTVPDPAPLLPRAVPDAVPAGVRLDLRPFGLRISPRRQPAVRDQGGRVVRLDLGSTPNELVLIGRIDGDSVTGVWYDDFRAGGAMGRFVMRRAHRSPANPLVHTWCCASRR